MTDEEIKISATANAQACMAAHELVHMASRIARCNPVAWRTARAEIGKIRARLDTIEAALASAEQEEAAA